MKLRHYLLSLALFAFSLPSCGEKEEPEEKESASVPDQPTSIVVYGWEDYIDPDLLTAFTAETGIEVEFQIFEVLEECEEKLETSPGEYDVVIAGAAVAAEWAGRKLIQPLDHQQLPLLSNIDEEYLGLETDPKNSFTVPYHWGTTVVAYRADKIEPDAESWNIFWDERVKGRAVIMDGDSRETFAIGLLKNGKSINDATPEDFDRAEADLKNALVSNHVQIGDVWENLDKLLTGEIWVMQAYSGDAAYWAEKEEAEGNIDYFIPNEGSPLWMDNWVIPSDSQKVAAAHQFINFMLDAEVAAQNANYLWYATPNRGAIEHLDPELRADPVVFPSEETLARCEFWRPSSAERENRLQIGMVNLHGAIGEVSSTRPASSDLTPVSADSAEEKPDED